MLRISYINQLADNLSSNIFEKAELGNVVLIVVTKKNQSKDYHRRLTQRKKHLLKNLMIEKYNDMVHDKSYVMRRINLNTYFEAI